jgi:hypothetical protein
LGVYSMSDHLPREASLTAEVISAQAVYRRGGPMPPEPL